jgi:hypothetical protein
MQIWRTDRFGRGGDHIPFLELGYPAARLSVAVENYNWQHQDLRTENGTKYGDLIENMDFAYLAKVTKLNIAALAWIASAPPPPEPTVDGAVSTDTTIKWNGVGKDLAYKVYKRRTDAANWESGGEIVVRICERGDCPSGPFEMKLEHIRVDDWVFGVSSVSMDGFESPVASAVPGGAFKPWVKPAEPAK